eukprot:1161894-Pelagomonas_calceolata.AAC.2
MQFERPQMGGHWALIPQAAAASRASAGLNADRAVRQQCCAQANSAGMQVALAMKECLRLIRTGLHNKESTLSSKEAFGCY